MQAMGVPLCRWAYSVMLKASLDEGLPDKQSRPPWIAFDVGDFLKSFLNSCLVSEGRPLR